METINFPESEYESLLNRLNNNQIIYTTRVSREVNKYRLNNTYESPFGPLKVIYLKHFFYLVQHPFLSQLTKEQIFAILQYTTNNHIGYDVIGLQRV